jgi:tetratricopeptide (TPR) repeat protein
VVPRDGHYVPAEGSELDLDAIGAPASLQALVAARLDALSVDERLVIADASVLGTVFTREGLVALGAGGAELDTSLDSLQRKEILTVQQDRFAADRGQFRFVQSVVRQVAYATQSRRDRKVRHLAAAEHLALQPDPGGALTVVIAQHLLDAVDAAASGEQGTEELVARACALLERAAVRAKALGSPGEARRLYEAALGRTVEDEGRARLHLAAARAASDAGDYRGAIEHASTASSAFDALDRPVDAGVAAGIQGYALALVSDPNRAIEVAEPRWRALDGVAGAEPALLQIAMALGRAHGDRGENAEMVRYVERRLWMAEATGDLDAIANAMITMGTRYAGPGAPTTACALYEGAAAIARDRDRPSILAHALNNLASVVISRDLPAGLRAAREGFEVARRAGVAGMIDYTTLNLGAALWLSGLLAEARAVAVEAESSMSIPSLRLALRSLQTRIDDALGLPGPPPHAPGEADGEGDTEADRTFVADLQVHRMLASGDAHGAAAVAADALPHVLAAMGIDDDFMLVWPPLVEAALGAGDLALAERMLRPVDAAAPGIVSAGVAAHWHLLRGFTAILRGDPDDEAEAELRTGLAALEAFGAVGLHAQAQEQVARWLVDRGRPGAAPLVEAARETYERIGADGWLARIEARHDQALQGTTTT